MNIEYTTVYILAEMFMAYVIYKYIHIFYSEFKFSKKIEPLLYIAYFLITSSIYIYIRIPLITIISTVTLFFVLVSFYYGNLKKSILSVSIMFISLACIETIIVFLTDIPGRNLFISFQHKSEFGIISIRIISYAFVLLAYGFNHVKSRKPLPFIYWLSLFFVPFGTIILFLITLSGSSMPSAYVIICIAIIFIINIVTFYLYDCISSFMSAQMDKQLLEAQNRYYQHQMELMSSSLENIKIFRHDLKNKLSPIQHLAISGKSEELIMRISELTETYCGNYGQSASGNSDIDNIINFKLQQAERENIKVTTKIIVPEKLSTSSFDLAVILGNLLDNSIEAVSMLKTNRWIKIDIKYKKGVLIFEISNSFDGVFKKSNETFITRKGDQENHGLGLKSIEAVIQKYHGIMQISTIDHVFTVKLLVYEHP
ncbi:GHKL domain-containing protein [Lacrimispora sp.]|uniref:GHKL domain-containing protein n=1 Tax=Lacrimispora sp. TaxID=2719234 RepID=UPI002FDA7870